MGWFGKITGGIVGGLLGGPLGLIAGAALGHIAIDRAGTTLQKGAGEFSSREQAEATYFVALFSLLGKMAKADGRISREEGALLKSLLGKMGMPLEQRKFAIRLFNEAKHTPHSIEELAQQFRDVVNGKYEMLLSMIDMLFRMAAADNVLDPGEERVLGTIAGIFGIPDEEMAELRRRYFAADTSEHYAVLNCRHDAPVSEIKKKYRELVNKFHPDKIVSKGLPEEFVDFSKKRFYEIQKAYNAVREERGF